MAAVDDLVLRWEIESGWGYAQQAPWYDAPTRAEGDRIHAALAAVGPPAGRRAGRAHRHRFLVRAATLLPAHAVLRRTLPEENQ